MREQQLNELDRMEIHPIYRHSERTIYLYSHKGGGSELVATFSVEAKFVFNTDHPYFYQLSKEERAKVLAIIIDFYTLELEQEIGLS